MSTHPPGHMYVPAEVKRQIVAEMADWLEGRHFQARITGGTDEPLAEIATRCWAEGYRRAIAELRWAAAEPIEIPDDISEIDET